MWKKCAAFLTVIALVVGSIQPVSYAAEAESVVEGLIDEENYNNNSSVAIEENVKEKNDENIAVSENNSIEHERNETDETPKNSDDATEENQDESIQGDSNETDEKIESENLEETKGETLPIISEEESDLSVSGNDMEYEGNKENGDSISSNTLADIGKNLNKLLDNYFDWMAHGTAGLSEDELLKLVSENVFNDMVRRYEGLDGQHKIIDEVSYEVLEQDLKGGDLEVNVSEIIDGQAVETKHLMTVSSEEGNQWCIENDIYDDTRISGILSNDLEISYYSFSMGYPNTWKNTGDQATDIANIALTQVGYHETTNDHTKYNNWFYGSDTSAAWCAIFISWCADQAGVSKSIVKKNARASGYNTSNMSSNPYGAPAYTFSSTEAKIGDIVFIDNTGNGTSNHVGLVYAVDSNYIYTIEGNYSEQVYKCKYLRSTGYQRYTNSTAANVHIVFYARPNYAVGTQVEGNLQMRVHAWFSDTIMGNKADVLISGNVYYLCYELIDVSTGKKLDEVHGGLSYTVTEKIKWPDGSIANGASYSNDNNYCGWNLHTAGNYTGIITISGNINLEVQVACTVQKKIELQMHRWMSVAEMGDGVSEYKQGEFYYDCYELIDRESGTRINGLATHNYTLLQEIYNPDGTLCTSYTHTNKDSEWLGFRARYSGTYTIRYTLKGTIGDGQYDYSVDKKINVIEVPITITASKNNVSLELGQKESETIDIVYNGYYNGSLSYHWERSNSNVSCSWGDSSDKTCPLTLTANAVGNAVVTVSMIDANTKQKLASTSILVSVIEKNYTITYYANGGTGAPSSQTKAHGSILTLSSVVPKRFGYNFLGWNTSSGASYASYKPGDSFVGNANTAFYAIWETAPTITVDPESFLQDVGNVSISIAGTTEYLRIIPKYSATYVLYSEGTYDTLGSLYDLEGNLLKNDDNGGDDLNFKIKYSLEKNTIYYLGVRLFSSSSTSGDIYIMIDKEPYMVTFDSRGGTSVSAQAAQSNGKVMEPAIPIQIGYNFGGWYVDKACTVAYDFDTILTEDLTLYAKWEKIEILKYLIEFDTQGGTAVESQIVSKGGKVNIPSEPIRVGYTFKGWYYNGELFDFDTEITADIILKAFWAKNGQVMAPIANIVSGSVLEIGTELCLSSENGATIYYTINGEEPTTESIRYINPIVISKTVTIRAFAVKEGYTNSEIVILTYVVKEEDREKLSAPFSNLVSGSEVEIGTKIVLICAASGAEIYYTLDGTTPDRSSTLYKEPIVVLGDTTIMAVAVKEGYQDSQVVTFVYHAVNSKLDVCMVVFQSNGGTQVDSQEVREGETATRPADPVREGYRFIGWYLDGELYDFTLPVTGNIRLEAVWELFDMLDMPVSNIASGKAVPEGTKIILSTDQPGAKIYYTLDDTQPTSASLLYSQTIVITENTVIRAIAVRKGWQNSPVATFQYTISVKKDDLGEILPEDFPEGGADAIPAGLWIAGVDEKGYTYTGKAIKPEVRVYDHRTLLLPNKDYSISYKNNMKVNDGSSANKAPAIVVTGKGNYSGKETENFKIVAKDIAAKDISVEDITVNYNKKVQNAVPTILWNGKKLNKKTDYTVEYPDRLENSDAYKNPGTYTILVKGKGCYSGERNVSLLITESKLMSKVNVSKIAAQSYTGEEITAAVMDKTPVVKSGRNLLREGVHYTVSYENNVEIGTATMILIGTGKETVEGTYAGRKKVTFKITGASCIIQI